MFCMIINSYNMEIFESIPELIFLVKNELKIKRTWMDRLCLKMYILEKVEYVLQDSVLVSVDFWKVVENGDTIVRIDPVAEGVAVQVYHLLQVPIEQLQVFHQQVHVFLLYLQSIAVLLIHSLLRFEDTLFRVQLF